MLALRWKENQQPNIRYEYQTMEFTFDELVTLNDAVATYIADGKEHWRYWRNKEPHFIQLVEDAEKLLARIQERIKTLDPSAAFNA